MMKNDIPEQQEGSEMDAAEHTTFADETGAKAFYPVARMRLLEISNWDVLCGFASATFMPTDALGKPLTRAVMEGDYIRINIPGPGTTTGDGFDWVKIELVQEETAPDQEMITIRARPTSNPLHAKQETAHFFKDKATSTIRVIRKGSTVYAEVHGRNEVPNSDTPVLINNIRNVIVGWTAKIGFSFPQWKSLVTALVKPEKP